MALHLVSFMNKLDRRFGFLQVSAEAQEIYPQLLGLGSEAWMPDGLGARINGLRRYVQSSSEDDVVIFADAFDVLVLGKREEILEKFQRIDARNKTTEERFK